MEKIKILASIITFNPEIARLNQNIKAIRKQVEGIVIVDNNSENIHEIQKIIKEECAYAIYNGSNKGIAFALNQALTFAKENAFDWVLTLDQDSVSADNLIAEYRRYINYDNIGIICSKVCDRNFQRKGELQKLDAKIEYVELCITSGSLTNTIAWENIGGFDSSMFIDSVDFDFCLTLKEKGWLILKSNETFIHHEVGKSKVVKIFGKEYLSLNHSPFRYYYIIRNNIYVGRKHQYLFLKNILVSFRIFYTVIVYERDKVQKILQMIRGLFDGLVIKIHRNE